jgi:hypothetical protein
VEKAYSPASGEFFGFGKIVADDETDSRLDKGIDVMNKMLVAIIDVNKTLADMNSNLGGKMDRMLQKQDELIIEVKDIGQSQNEMLVEVKDINKKAERVWEREIVEMKRVSSKKVSYNLFLATQGSQTRTA